MTCWRNYTLLAEWMTGSLPSLIEHISKNIRVKLFLPRHVTERRLESKYPQFFYISIPVLCLDSLCISLYIPSRNEAMDEGFWNCSASDYEYSLVNLIMRQFLTRVVTAQVSPSAEPKFPWQQRIYFSVVVSSKDITMGYILNFSYVWLE